MRPNNKRSWSGQRSGLFTRTFRGVSNSLASFGTLSLLVLSRLHESASTRKSEDIGRMLINGSSCAGFELSKVTNAGAWYDPVQ